MDKHAFAHLINALAAQWRVEVTDALLTGYWLGCHDLGAGAFEGAIMRAIQECERMPTAHELRKLAGEVSPETAATMAWAAVLRAIPVVGSYRSVDFGPLVNAVIRCMGGWAELCRRDSDDLRKWARQEFERAYLRLSTTRLPDEMTTHLPGIVERANKALGISEPPVRLLDAAKTKALTRPQA